MQIVDIFHIVVIPLNKKTIPFIILTPIIYLLHDIDIKGEFFNALPASNVVSTLCTA